MRLSLFGEGQVRCEEEHRQADDGDLQSLVLGFLTLDPSAFLSKVHVPVLAMNGSKDLQVPADANLSAVESALKAAGNTSYRLLKLDGPNHLFQHAGSGLPAEYGKLTETFAPEALFATRDFILGLR